MIRWFSVLASRLHEREFCWDDREIRKATLFPFFDGEGVVEQVLVVDAESSELRAFRLDATRVRIPFWGPIRLEGNCDRLDEEVIRQLGPLWHYDPWWLLKDERFSSHEAVPILKQTNCVGAFIQQPVDVGFRADLTSLRNVRYEVASNPVEEKVSGYLNGTIAGMAIEKEQETRPFRPGMLPVRETTGCTVSARQRGWQLTPFWQ